MAKIEGPNPSGPTTKKLSSERHLNRATAAKPKAISTIQNLQFKLIQRASFNRFDGSKVVADLKNHRNLWEAVVMDCPGWSFKGDEGEMIDLIKLRDISSNYWNVDTLYILATRGKERRLEALARTWNADEIRWIEGEHASDALGEWPAKNKILAMWWD